MGESAAVTVQRELREELEIDAQVRRLLWAVDNFFEWNGVRWHELALYFLIDLPPNCPLCSRTDPFPGIEDKLKLWFKWHPVAAMESVPLYPTFLRAGLQSLPGSAQYIAHTDPSEMQP
jgi:ADP-ribose pyrophosphatase YjhB (NUDIX family)